MDIVKDLLAINEDLLAITRPASVKVEVAGYPAKSPWRYPLAAAATRSTSPFLTRLIHEL